MTLTDTKKNNAGSYYTSAMLEGNMVTKLAVIVIFFMLGIYSVPII